MEDPRKGTSRNENDVDRVYLNKLEKRLSSLKIEEFGGKVNSNKILEELACIREQQLFELISGRPKDDCLAPVPSNNYCWLQRKIAPESLALSKVELLGLVNCDHLEPISFCNTYSLHLMDQDQRQLVIDINGTVHWAEWSGESDGISLKECLEGPEKEMADFDLELVASDSLLLAGKGTLEKYAFDGCIGTCWVVYDHLFAVERQFAALFLIEPNFCIKMVARFALQSMPTFSKIEQTTDHQIRWLVCTYSHGISAFSVEHDGSVTYKPKVDPMLALSDVSGTVIRYEHILTWGPHRLLLVGYDTGFVTASICPTRRDASDEHLPLIDRKSLKFDGPVSVLKVLRVGEKSLSVLVSSTLGPATVWTLRKNENDLQQLSWHLSTVLQESELYDTVVTGTVYNSGNCGKVDNAIGGVDDGGGGMVLIGTYGELLLAYDLHELLSQQDEVGPLLSINIASPILAVEQFGEELLVLSNRGLHRLSPSADEALALTQQQRKSPATVTTTTTPPAKTTDENTQEIDQTRISDH